MARKTYVSIAEMAARYGYTFNAVKKWVSEGLPFNDKQSSGPNGIPELEGTEWILKNKINPLREISTREAYDIAKLREQEAKADLATISVKEKSGELISIDYVQKELNRFCADIKDRIRLIPAKHSIELIENADTVDNFKKTLRGIIDNELNDIALAFDEPDIEQDTDTDKDSDSDSDSEPEQDSITDDIDLS